MATTGGKYIEITKMLTPWINYLQKCNWRQRGQPPLRLVALRPMTSDLRLATAYAAVGVMRVPSTGPFMRFEIAVSRPSRTMPAISKYHQKF